MKRYRFMAVWLALCPAIVPVCQSQQNTPHIGYVYPAGGRQGTVFEVQVGGQFLAGVNQAYVSGTGVQVSVVDYTRPMTPMQAMDMRTRLQELLKKPQAQAQKEIQEIRLKLAGFTRNLNPVIAETVTLQVRAAEYAEPGGRELRLAAPAGLSNPLVFRIGQLAEVKETETTPVINNQQVAWTPDAETRITLPAVANGRIKPGPGRPSLPPRPGQQFTPGDVDRYRFEARRGQHILVEAGARELIPYLADAVPGWFQAVVAFYDSGGRQLAYGDDYTFHPDPVLHCEIPSDGEYVLEIKDALYRGREDFVYRMTVGELPFITGIFPLGGRAGIQTKIQLSGWNLLQDGMTIDAEGKEPGVYPVSVHSGEVVSNTVPFAVDTLPEIVEQEPNDATGSSQRVRLPVVVNGRTDRPGDRDVFSFEGRAGDRVTAEVSARRLDSPLDSVLELTDARGRRLAFNDDHEDKGSGLNTHHADSLISAVLPSNGTYFVHIGDVQQKGGREYAYRLRISPPRPDFEIRVAPSAINAASGMTVPITVYALRKDGFSGDIALALKNLPRGFVLSGAVIPAAQERVTMTLTVPPLAARDIREPVRLSLEGIANIQGREVRRSGLGAEDMMQAFAYHHLVPARDLMLAVARRVVFRTPASVAGERPVKIPVGGTARLQARLDLPPNNTFEKIYYELSEPPAGIELQEASQDGTIVLKCDGQKAKSGTRGNLIIQLFGEREMPAGAGKARANRRRIPLGVLPAIPFEVVDQSFS